MGAEGHPPPQEREIDPFANFQAVAKSFSDNIRALSELAQERRAGGGTLTPEAEEKFKNLKNQIVNAHVQPL